MATFSSQMEPAPVAPLYSTLAADPDLGELVEMFVGEMPDRARCLAGLWAAGELDALQMAAHQLKGSAGGYGFPQLTASAARLEGSLREQAAPEILRDRTNELVALCGRARAGTGE
ncbi:MAG TPA: Hpt domain-containing protein [Pirellulales bacterium]|jgi:HPt (histidine-containing phosphotransfer) domain-containing protein|nr:Hpt domain-containing protein [Pirellulales bacterium]